MKAIVSTTRVYHFCAGHRLFRADWSDERNWETFGPCSYPESHGHNYTLEVTVRGVPDADTGWVVPPTVVDHAVEEHVMARFDHRNLNQRLRLEYGAAPTTEILVMELWDNLLEAIAPPAQLYRLKVSETSKNSFEYWGLQDARL